MSAFDALPAALQAALSRLHISTPTPVQQAALPLALKGRDVLATSQTGTGKTFAFLLPLLVRLQQSPDATALILSPTRELAQQTQDALQSLLTTPEEMPSALIIGGDNIHKQYADLRRKPRIIIGTPGRVIDHIGRKSLTLKNTAFLVLDEADRMLDMGFIPDVRKICSAVPGARQTFLFSATLPKEIEELSDGFLQNPVRVQIGSVTRPVDLVLQQFVRLTTREKLPQLVHELQTRKGLVLVFVKSRHGAERLAKQLKLYGCKVAALHGDLRQSRRRQVMEQFRLGDVPALVATDVAARGIDVDGISCVINYDLPQCPEDYIHRIGRTGRAGSVGTALSFVTEDKDKWAAICRVCRLGKLTELTKTSQVLPAPKFVPGAPVKKKSAGCAQPASDSQRARAGAAGRTPAKDEAAESLRRGTEERESVSFLRGGDILADEGSAGRTSRAGHLDQAGADDSAQAGAEKAPCFPPRRRAAQAGNTQQAGAAAAVPGLGKKKEKSAASAPAVASAKRQGTASAVVSSKRQAPAPAKPQGGVVTFRKASRAAEVLTQEEQENAFWTQNGFAVLRVGFKKQAAKKRALAQQPGRSPFASAQATHSAIGRVRGFASGRGAGKVFCSRKRRRKGKKK